ncbi:MAG: peptidase M24 [Acidimicrobiaceae bacterium]|nr:peptidase M24 [Acidimicrobiaceae bacterium]
MDTASRYELELGRLDRLRAQLVAADCDAGVFYDPVNVRYATGTSNMQVYSLHNPCRYAYVPVEGPVVLFDFKGCEHLSDGHPAVGEVRDATSWYHFVTGPRTEDFAGQWAHEIVELLGAGRSGPGSRRVAIDRLDPFGLRALERHGVEVVDGQAVANLAKAVKTPREVDAVRRAMAACDGAIDQMAQAFRPGMTEQELWAVLHRANIEAGGEWFETRLLTSGPRTNPWYQEASDRVIEPGDLVAFDTDLIGVGGYSIDISRTWVAGDAPASSEQRRMYTAAYEQVVNNIELVRPGVSFRELSEKAWLPPEGLHSRTNACVAHGVGMCNEYPLIVNQDHFPTGGYDGVIEEGMVLCVEGLVAPPGGREAVKLEEQVLVTATGAESLSTTPFDEALLA